MIVIGLTGSIGMGKTTCARALEDMGIPVHDADKTVHDLLATDAGVQAEVGRAFGATVPGLIGDGTGAGTGAGAVDRAALGRHVFCDAEALARLETILHPRVRAAEEAFLAAAKRRGETMAVLEIPLLFETGGEKRVDVTILASAAEDVQKARVLARPNMTESRLAAIRASQMPDAEKRKRADFIVATDCHMAETLRQLGEAVRVIGEGKSPMGEPDA